MRLNFKVCVFLSREKSVCIPRPQRNITSNNLGVSSQCSQQFDRSEFTICHIACNSLTENIICNIGCKIFGEVSIYILY